MSRHRSSFSLASLFLLICSISVLMAATRSSVLRWENKDVAFEWIAGGAVFGALAGIVTGLTDPRWFRGAIMGFFVGSMTGASAGAQLAAPPDVIVVVVGICVLIALSLVLRPKLDPIQNDENADDSSMTAHGQQDR